VLIAIEKNDKIAQQKPFKMLWVKMLRRKLQSKWVDGEIMENKPHRRKKNLFPYEIHHIKIKHVTAYASVYA
jgi:hypothetical protein